MTVVPLLVQEEPSSETQESVLGWAERLPSPPASHMLCALPYLSFVTLNKCYLLLCVIACLLKGMQNARGEKRAEELGCDLLRPLNLSFLHLFFPLAHKKCRIRFLEFRVPPSHLDLQICQYLDS